MFLMLLLLRLRDLRVLRLGFALERFDEFDLVTSGLSNSLRRMFLRMKSNTSR